MIKQTILIEVRTLRVRFKTTIRHAAATRNEGESIWIQAKRNGNKGYGEGCPRTYVAGDDLESSVKWVEENFSTGKVNFETLDDLKQWVENNSTAIDKYPSAWCAIEMALLDLFSRERGCNVERLLELDGYELCGRYTAVLGDDKKWKYTTLVDKYLIRGFSDFKIKLNGNLERDMEKLYILEDLCIQHNTKDIRIRFDANNLWKDQCDEAIAHITALGGRVFALEEPVGSRNARDISKISMATGLPVILDESLCTLDDLSLYKNIPGKFIANIKISRVGGLIRALRLIEELKKLGWPIIIGCHVGETSLLTRAALIAASAAGESLIAHEGAFGDYLVEREPVEPMLKFGRNGLLNLSFPYYFKTVQGLKVIPAENWNTGFGMQCRMPIVPDDGTPEVHFLEMPDKYKIHYRVWGKTEGENVVLILHGGMSHSGWQAPLANQLRSMSPDISVVAPDRRGCGLNEKRGDLGSVQFVIEDVIKHIEFLKKSFKRIHLAGWCQGSQYASVAAAKLGDMLSSLILLTPGFFWNERFRSVLSIAEKIVMDMISEFKLKPERNHACIPIPMEATDFTLIDEWLDFIDNDDLKTTMITLKSVSIMDEIQELSWFAILQNTLPVLAIMAENDRIVDNNKVLQFIGHLFTGNNQNRLVSLESGHAIQFEKPEEVATEILNFIRQRNDDLIRTRFSEPEVYDERPCVSMK
ncbi:MAG: alpha/beta fold hydrolase [Deltaproteobacteria bacterium]|nr:alpha/beta fold hydrolase [Deltaproteobacteria bacterium]